MRCSEPAIASRLQSNALVGRVAELGSLGVIERATNIYDLRYGTVHKGVSDCESAEYGGEDQRARQH
jgi:hypothetical protein